MKERPLHGDTENSACTRRYSPERRADESIFESPVKCLFCGSEIAHPKPRQKFCSNKGKCKSGYYNLGKTKFNRAAFIRDLNDLLRKYGLDR